MKNKVSSQIPQMETNPRPIGRTVKILGRNFYKVLHPCPTLRAESHFSRNEQQQLALYHRLAHVLTTEITRVEKIRRPLPLTWFLTSSNFCSTETWLSLSS